MRVVLDTNVLASGLLSRNSTSGALLLLWTYDVFDLLFSPHILDELTRTLSKPYFLRRLTVEQVDSAIEMLRREGRHIIPSEVIFGVATHPEDDLILATAVSGDADCIVTGDSKLLRLGTYRGVQIASPREFLDILTHDTD